MFLNDAQTYTYYGLKNPLYNSKTVQFDSEKQLTTSKTVQFHTERRLSNHKTVQFTIKGS